MTGPRRERWAPKAPAARLALLRVAVGAFATGYVASHFGSFIHVTRLHPSEFAPVGPLVLLSAPLPALFFQAITAVTVLVGAAFTAGLAYRWIGPLFGVLLLFTTSYRNSWGMIFHTEDLLVLHVLLLAVAPAADACCIAAPGARPAPPAEGPDRRYGWSILAMSIATAITYALAGVAKLKLLGADWLDGEILRAQIAYDNLRKIELGGSPSLFGRWLVQQTWPFPAFALLTLVIEVGAPLALLPRLGKLWALGAWSFHVGVFLLMGISFPYPLSFIAYLSLFEIERLRDTRLYAALAQRLRLG